MWIARSRLFGSIACLIVSFAGGPAHATEDHVAQVETVKIPIGMLPFDLVGLLRRASGAGRRAAGVVLLPTCARRANTLDEEWGARISSWGYVTLTIDGYGPRGIKECIRLADTDARDLAADAYRALGFLTQKGLVDPRRVAVVGFGRGAWQALSATERGEIEQTSAHKFRAVAAFYPPCEVIKGTMTIPALLLIGSLDGSVDSCRKLAAGDDDFGISRQKGEGAPVQLIVYPDAHRGFDMPALRVPRELSGHHAEYNKAAADQSSAALRGFLDGAIGEPR
jgi:dienelactone hydrolase